jgi:RNase P subunit RPR2
MSDESDDDGAIWWDSPCEKCGSHLVHESAGNMTAENSLDLSWYCADCGNAR